MHKAQILKWLGEIRASYWFIPSLMVIGAIVASVFTVWLDGEVSTEWPEHVPFLFSNKPEGARALLATVAGSMITVAGVTFSLTLLAVSHATGYFGPRLLGNFMRDRGNQITLGTFIATFIYCLLILRTVRSAESPLTSPNNDELVVAFVPHISLSVALLLTLCSVGVLIYFIHHIPESIRLSNVVSGVGRQLVKSIEQIFPEMIAEDQPDEAEQPPIEDVPPDFCSNSEVITLNENGYVQTVDETGLLELAEQSDLIIFLEHRPGDFYCAGKSLVRVWPAKAVTDTVRQRVPCLFALGVNRTLSQNVMFGFDQLVEVAQRALSPGLNDPMTAMYCLDWLQTALVSLTKRKQAEVFRYNEDGQLRIFSRSLTFADFCDRVFDQLRPYVAADRNVSIHMLNVINAIRSSARTKSQIEQLNRHADRLFESVAQSQPVDFDLRELQQQNREGIEAIGAEPSLDHLFKGARELSCSENAAARDIVGSSPR